MTKTCKTCGEALDEIVQTTKNGQQVIEERCLEGHTRTIPAAPSKMTVSEWSDLSQFFQR